MTSNKEFFGEYLAIRGGPDRGFDERLFSESFCLDVPARQGSSDPYGILMNPEKSAGLSKRIPNPRNGAVFSGLRAIAKIALELAAAGKPCRFPMATVQAYRHKVAKDRKVSGNGGGSLPNYVPASSDFLYVIPSWDKSKTLGILDPEGPKAKSSETVLTKAVLIPKAEFMGKTKLANLAFDIGELIDDEIRTAHVGAVPKDVSERYSTLMDLAKIELLG